MANNIKVERTRFEYTQEELAKMVGVSVGSIKKWEADIDTCSIGNAVTLSNIFGCSVDFLIGLTDERRRNRASGNE